ncbi:MAG: enoyl-CoA hydratase [Dehalococcoidia bacterium]|nr:enoyl-CoA hydratase [Dehalococcoidia bacterium]
MPYETIIVEKKDGVARITFNRPEVLNAFSPRMSEELKAAVGDIKSDKETRVVVITGSGDRAFMSGADIDKTILAWVDMTKKGKRVMDDHKVYFYPTMLEELPQPVIAAINGFAFGMGSEIALGCDIRIASENAQFAQPEIRLGIMCGGGGSVRLTRLVGKGKALEMCLTGDPIDAKEAYRIGLVNQVVPAGELENAVNAMVKRLVFKGGVALASTKASIVATLEMGVKDAIENEARLFSDIFKTEDAEEGAKAFLEKRRPQFKGK